MVDRTPQQFPNGTPDGTTDNTAAIQAAIDAWQPGDQVVLSGGTFRTSAKLVIPSNGLIVRGDGAIRARSVFAANSTLFEVTGTGVVFDTDGLELDQADVMVSGDSIRAVGAVGLQVLNVVSRATQEAFVRLDSFTTDVLVAGCDHHGKGYGVVTFDAAGLARIVVRDSRFEHPGTGTAGDGVQLSCPTHGASAVEVIGCVAKGYIGEATNQGIGFGFARVTDGRLIGCRAEDCESDGFHLEHESHRWVCSDLQALDIGIANPVGGNGSGFVAYDSDDVSVVLTSVRNCGFHGIALSGQGGVVPSQLRLNGRIERCSIDTTRRDGIHVTAQKAFRIDRNRVRDPSLGNPLMFAGIRVGRQGGTTLENENGAGLGNTVVLSGASTPLGEIVVRPDSVNVSIDGVSGTLALRITEGGEERITEDGEQRTLEAA